MSFMRAIVETVLILIPIPLFAWLNDGRGRRCP